MWGDACYSKKYLLYLLWEATSQGSQQSWRFFCLYVVLFGVTICWLLDKGIYTEHFWLLDKGIYTEHLLIVGQGHLQRTFVDGWTKAFTMQLTMCWLLDKGIYTERLLIVGQRHLHWTFVHCWTKAFTLNICWLLDKGIYSEHLLIVRQRHLRWAFVDCWTKAFTLSICWLLDKGIYAEHLPFALSSPTKQHSLWACCVLGSRVLSGMPSLLQQWVSLQPLTSGGACWNTVLSPTTWTIR